MNYVGKYLDELSDAELRTVEIIRAEDRLKVSDRELVVREKKDDGKTVLTVTRVLSVPESAKED